MNTLKDHLILFDADCPMCNVYTKAFVKAGLLDRNGREAYQHVDAAACPMIDRQRAVNEIALVNQKTGEVTYGVQSLFKVIGTAVPALQPLFTFKPFVWLSSKAYAFVSYNRRVIVPGAQEGAYPFKPTFKLHYRLAYLLFTLFVTAFILTRYVPLLSGLLPAGSGYSEYLICGGQIIFQACIMCAMFRHELWDYLGNMMTISLAGALLLVPMLLLKNSIGAQPFIYAGYFLVVVSGMFFEHIRRTKLLHLGWALTITWVVYRSVVLLTIMM